MRIELIKFSLDEECSSNWRLAQHRSRYNLRLKQTIPNFWPETYRKRRKTRPFQAKASVNWMERINASGNSGRCASVACTQASGEHPSRMQNPFKEALLLAGEDRSSIADSMNNWLASRASVDVASPNSYLSRGRHVFHRYWARQIFLPWHFIIPSQSSLIYALNFNVKR